MLMCRLLENLEIDVEDDEIMTRRSTFFAS
jgi:hypothetical protein